VLGVIEGDDRIIKPNRGKRHGELVEVRSRNTFKLSQQLVAEPAGGAALKRRQARCVSRPWKGISGKPISQAGKRRAVGRRGQWRRRVRLDEKLIGVRRDERISPEVGLPQRAIEKDTMRQRGQLQKHRLRLGHRPQLVNQREIEHGERGEGSRDRKIVGQALA
jgi:hypothetical protein